MEEPRFLTLEQVLALHRSMIERHGGEPGIRDRGLIESAVMIVQQAMGGQYLHPTPAAMAAACLYHLCSNHGFADGNKRVAVGAALVFLDANGFEIDLLIDDLERITLDVASSQLAKADLTRIFEAACRPIAGST